MPSRNINGISYFLLLLLEKGDSISEKFDIFLSTFPGNTLVCESSTEGTTILVFFILKLVLIRRLVIILIGMILLNKVNGVTVLTIDL